jgi:uncharacterized protein YkwD
VTINTQKIVKNTVDSIFFTILLSLKQSQEQHFIMTGISFGLFTRMPGGKLNKHQELVNHNLLTTTESHSFDCFTDEHDTCHEIANQVDKRRRSQNKILSHRKILSTRLRRRNHNQYEEVRSVDSTECTSSVGTKPKRKIPVAVTHTRIPRFIVSTDNSCAIGNIETISQDETIVVDDNHQIIEQSRRQPQLWKYASNHVMINQERVRRNLPPLIRLHELDQLARMRAEEMAKHDTLFYATPQSILIHLKKSFDCNQLKYGHIAENICKGSSINDIHAAMIMTTDSQECSNILSQSFRYMGMASVRAKLPSSQCDNCDTDNVQLQRRKLYLCQIFAG